MTLNAGGLFEEKDEEINDYHIITTNNPYMADLGLNVFTTGTLYNWWRRKNSGQFMNQKYFDLTGGFDETWLLGGGGVDTGVSGHFFTAWDQNTKSWKSHEDVANNGGDWNWSNYDGTRNYVASQLAWWFSDAKNFGKGNLYTGEPLYTAADGPVTMTPLARIIEMNNWAIKYTTEYPDETVANHWNDVARAASQFIRGIKSSLNHQGIIWSGLIPFDFKSQVPGGGSCVKKEWVTFNLQLFDSNRPKNRTRTAALDISKLNLVGSPIDSLGVEYRLGSYKNGEHELSPANGDPAGQVAGGLDVTYNEFTGKYESGTAQIMAILETDVPAAINYNGVYPSITELQSAKVEDILNTSSNAYFNPGTGLAMPIVMQNANPLQWSPQYKESAGCRTTEKKQSVPVVNISGRSYTKGTTVILSKINGVWIPIDFGEGPAEDPTVSEFEGKWQFTYLMTNWEYFFKRSNKIDTDASRGIDFAKGGYLEDSNEYENSFWHEYYCGEDAEGRDERRILDKKSPVDLQIASPTGFYQITSWDFMGTGIGGTRNTRDGAGIEGHSLGNTIALLDTQGNVIPNENPGDPRGTHSNFFGCVFPGGYDTDGKFASYNTNNKYKVTGVDTHNGPDAKFFSNTTSEIPTIGFFDPKNDKNTGEGSTEGGMFSAGTANVPHLPADIATNASPSGTNGTPIVDMNRLSKYMTLGAFRLNDTTSIPGFIAPALFGHKNSEEYFKDYKRYAWMQLSTDAQGAPTENFTSAFDFKPRQPDYVQFRPLKAEIYANFDIQMSTEINSATNRRSEFGARSWEFVNDGESPISWNFLDRNQGLQRNAIFTNGGYGNGDGEAPINVLSHGGALRYGQRDATAIDAAGYFSFGNNVAYSFINETYYGEEGLGAYGIIGATCTVKTAGNITITTDPQLGQRYWRANETGSSWSKGDNTIRHKTTSVMYGRVFVAWPRDLTVYDPRFFAVHHFNPGVGIAKESFDYRWYNGTNGAIDGQPPNPADYGYPNKYWQRYDKNAIPDVDLTYPTVEGATSSTDGKGVFADPGDQVYSDEVIAAGGLVTANDVFKGPMRARKDWDYSPSNGRKRRGKLLPYFYSWFSLGISSIIETKLAGQKLTEQTNIVILNQGTGYKDTDRFTTTYGTGRDVLLKPILDGTMIKGFEVVDSELEVKTPEGFPVEKRGNGRDFSPADFISKTKLFDENGSFKNVGADTVSSLKIQPITSSGEGLSAFIIKGEVVMYNAVDAKPIEITDGPDRLTAIPATENIGGEDVTALLTATQQTQIDTNNVSPDKRYDIFLFMQNEVSHTFAEDWSGSSAPKAPEQWVNVSIGFV